MRAVKKALTIRKTPEQCLTCVFLCGVFIFLPLFVHRAYYDITRTKFTVFSVLAGLYLLSMLPFIPRIRPRIELPDIFCICFFSVFALTSALNGAWLAEGSRYQGFISAILYALTFMLVRRCGVFGRNERMALLIGFSLCALVALCEYFGFDFLGIVAATPESERMRFISTVGNISFFSAMCCIMFPVPVSLYLRSGSKGGRGLYFLLSLLFLTAAMVSRAESALLGVLAALALVPSLSSPEEFGRYPLFVSLLLAWAFLFSLISRLSLYGLSELTRSICRAGILLPLCAVFSSLHLVLRNADIKKLRSAVHIYRVVLIFSASVFVIFLVLANTLLSDRLSGGLSRYFVITDSWGTDRGLIWRRCIEYYGSLGFAGKVFGAGAGSIAVWDSLHPIFEDAVTDSAHNEYLTYLITNGVFGLSAYLGLAVSSAVIGRRHILLSAVLAYMVQASVNIAQPFTTPVFFLFLALVSGGDKAEGAVGIAPQEFSGSVIILSSLAVLIASAIFISASPY